jgi:hypothetical protein
VAAELVGTNAGAVKKEVSEFEATQLGIAAVVALGEAEGTDTGTVGVRTGESGLGGSGAMFSLGLGLV